MPAGGAKLFALCFGLFYICQPAAEGASDRSAGITPAQSRTPADTLIIYIYAQVGERHKLQTSWLIPLTGLSDRCIAQTDMESRNNLIFFLQHGVLPGDGAHYIVTVQADNATLVRYAPPLFKQVYFAACHAQTLALARRRAHWAARCSRTTSAF